MKRHILLAALAAAVACAPAQAQWSKKKTDPQGAAGGANAKGAAINLESCAEPMGTIAVVWTTITIVVLKVFDIVFVMTNGQWGTQVLANLMYDWMFRGTPDYGRGSAIAIILMLLVTPIMIWNIVNARREVR